MITAKEFEKIEGKWNGKLYGKDENIAYKNGEKYEIEDPKNLTLKEEKRVGERIEEEFSRVAERVKYSKDVRKDKIFNTTLSLLSNLEDKYPEDKEKLHEAGKIIFQLIYRREK